MTIKIISRHHFNPVKQIESETQMPTNFIAVQCFQCSTMQVKQEKKSSNKWNCVVCGEKQSLRQVFAQGFMAKDVRAFVQKFNMSRCQFQEEKELLDSLPKSEMENERKRRTDWTEYVDDETEECLGEWDFKNDDSDFEAMVVTEIPKELFAKKPKLKRNSVSGSRFDKFQRTGSKGGSVRKQQDACSDEENVESNDADRAFKWNAVGAKIHKGDNDTSATRKSLASQPTKRAGGLISKWGAYSTGNENEAKGPVSKWSSFVTEDDDDQVQIRERGSSSNCAGYMTSDALDSLVNDEKVEDDVHPDFL